MESVGCNMGVKIFVLSNKRNIKQRNLTLKTQETALRDSTFQAFQVCKLQILQFTDFAVCRFRSLQISQLQISQLQISQFADFVSFRSLQ